MSEIKTPGAAPVKIDGKTIPDAYLKRVALTPKQRVFLVKKDGTYQPSYWSEFHEKVRGVFASLKKAGIQPGDRVAILAQSSPEWIMCDMANLLLGAITVPIYHSNIPEDVGFIVKDSGA